MMITVRYNLKLNNHYKLLGGILINYLGTILKAKQPYNEV